MNPSQSLFRSRFWSACLGNLFEHYDAALFGFLSPFLAPLIFPKHEAITALILTYAMIPLGMLARPLGSLVFGYMGDVYGRRCALFWTLGGMALVSGCIAMSPTYSQAGVLSPILFCLGRVAQNFLAAGESMGGAIYLLESAPEKKHDLLSSLYNASTIGGILLASSGVALLYHWEMTLEGWRLLYLIGCVTALFGFWLRRGANIETLPPVSQRPRFSMVVKTFWEFRRPLVLIAICSGFAYANYTMALVLINGFIPLITPFTKADMMGLNTALLVFDFCALPLCGWFATKISRDKLMLGTALTVVITAAPLCFFLKEASFVGVLVIRIFFVLAGVAFFAPFHAWAGKLVPAKSRYAIVSLGYALGSQLLGGPTAPLSLWLFKTTGSAASIAIYWATLGLLASVVLVKARKTVLVGENG